MKFEKLSFARSFMLGSTCALALAACNQARADVVVVSSGNASANVDEATGTVTDLSVGGVTQAAQQSFFYRIGDTGPQQSFSSLTPTGVSTFPGSIFLNYAGPGFTVQLSYSLLGGSSNVSPAQLLNSLFISAALPQSQIPLGSVVPADGQTPIDLHIFQYDHFTLDGSLSNNVLAANTASSEIDQSEIGQVPAIRSASANVVAIGDRYQIGPSPSILNSLTDGSPATLSDGTLQATGPVGPGNVEFALETDAALGPFGVVPLVTIDTFNPGVPVPPAVWMGLTTLAAIAGIGAMRRVRTA
jgi:hypothetical protein